MPALVDEVCFQRILFLDLSALLLEGQIVGAFVFTDETSLIVVLLGRRIIRRATVCLVLLGLGGSCSLGSGRVRSEEHTSELQSRPHLVCRLLLEKKKKI